ncbi:AlpA family transcriptional regulator [Chitinibacter tainanensis]|jgi:predicted DNA-binding transcriptional regulator AlpA|uniref:helix-turn-helix transcriptional regulator n=1 Tax=Chitinibacter tainanensis TaxID=230667 RepID=UPI002355F28E|nr:helix-turn-helix domain-containing protein [Chitinibacter tainanensis]
MSKASQIQSAQSPALRPKFAAQYLGISLSHTWRLVAEGKLPPPVKLSPAISLFRRADLDAFLEKAFAENAK